MTRASTTANEILFLFLKKIYSFYGINRLIQIGRIFDLQKRFSELVFYSYKQ